MNWTFEYVWIIPLLPLIAFLIILLDRACERLLFKEIFPANGNIALLVIGATTLGFFQSLLIFLNYPVEHGNYEVNFNWINAGNLTLSFGWLVDNLSIMMLLVVTSVSLLIQIYTHGYMKNDPGYRRFFAYLALFNFSMLGLVLSTNLFQIYIFWELVGLCSYLLIGFWLERPSAAKAAKKAFIVNRIGDCLFLIGIVAFLYFSFSYWESSKYSILTFAHLDYAVNVALFKAGPIIFSIVAICLFFGAIAKSAQFPLHTWLPDAMEGPTPISALIHAATMVAAGVFLVARIYPVFTASTISMNFIAWIGAITILITATIALTQTDIKRVLAYSTCSQLGYMIMAMGIGAYSAGLFHLFTHAYFKAMLFLCSGAVIHGLSGEQDMKFMGGLRKYMPITSWTYLIGAFSISGILLSGFWSKDMILGKAFENIFLPQNMIISSSLETIAKGQFFNLNAFCLFVIALISAGLTAFYMFRSYFMTFEGTYRGHAHPHESPKVMTYPLIVLAVPSAFIGFIFSGLKIETLGIHLPDFSKYIYYIYHSSHEISIPVAIMSICIAIAGLGGAIIMYWDKYKTKDPDKLIKEYKPYYLLSFNKWYFDDIYYWLINNVFMLKSKLCAAFDKYFIDEIVNMIAQIIKELGVTFKYIQNGKVQFSALVMYTGLVIISIVFVVYSLI